MRRPAQFYFPVLIPATIVLAACARPLPAPHPCAAPGDAGAVVSAEADATNAGLDILRAGGSAADAAVAVALALAVVHPQAGNLGGGGFAVVKNGDAVTTLDFRETAPRAASHDMFLGPDGKTIPDASLVGGLAAGVPGSPAGLYELHHRHGVLPWRTVVEPALRLARDGFTVSPRLHDAIEWERDLLARFPETAAVWLPEGKPPEPGTVMRLPELAATLATYSERGPEAIMSGPVAAAVAAAAHDHGGLLTTADLLDYRPIWREPLRFRAFGWEVASMRLPSSGGFILVQSLGMLERLGWSDLPRSSVDRLHLLAEVWRRAYADRFLLGDPARMTTDVSRLLGPAWIAERAAGIDLARATPSARIRPWPGIEAGEAAATTHLSVADGAGEMVALTSTLNGWFGCGVYVRGAGFLLNNEMDDFVIAPGRPNMFGLVQGKANSVAPGARMLSSMCPTIAWRGDVSIALGSPGGSRIPTATMQVLLDLIVDHDPLQAAVDRPRIHHQWLPDQIAAERGALDDRTRAALVERGHTIRDVDPIGEVSVVRRRSGGRLEAAADARGPGVAGLTPQ
ncbi:MAG: gamma-glutamyltransferase [Acidobacteria bacterium 13_1_40CM_4_69_4]|nr:MAG: gamma-glutamyltransferase [Acidobacteria bacterium 13_1_40CM_4_69_4]